MKDLGLFAIFQLIKSTSKTCFNHQNHQHFSLVNPKTELLAGLLARITKASVRDGGSSQTHCMTRRL
jgi:hypothetical protein